MPINSLKPETAQKFEKGDLVYGVEKVAGAAGYQQKGRKWYIDNGPFKDKQAQRIDSYALLQDEEKRGTVTQAEQESFKKAMQKHDNYCTAVDADSEANENVRRKSKGGLYWATMVEGKNVHFILDGLDMKSVVEKNFNKGDNRDSPADKDGPKNRTFTGAELRWIYRHRDNEKVAERVQFWLNGVPCAAPWLRLPKLNKYGKVEINDDKLDWGEDEDSEKRARDLWSSYKPKCEQIDYAARSASANQANEESPLLPRDSPESESPPQGCLEKLMSACLSCCAIQ
jgi:hypothetical protein